MTEHKKVLRYDDLNPLDDDIDIDFDDKNPFFSTPTTNLEEKNYGHLKRDYVRALVLHLKTKKIPSKLDKLFRPNLTESDVDQLADFLTLESVDMNLLHVWSHRRSAVIVDRSWLTKFNHNDIDLEGKEIVVPLLELSSEGVSKYLSLFKSGLPIKEIQDLTALADMVGASSVDMVKTKKHSLWKSLDSSSYWTHKYNCHINMTKGFLERGFTYKDINLEREHIKRTLAPANSDIKTDVVIEALAKMKDIPNYLRFIYRDIDKPDTGEFKYWIDNTECDISPDMIIDNITKSDIHSKFNIFNSLLLSKKYCHLAFTKQILNEMSPIIQKALPFYRYVFGYPWLCFYAEELIKKTRIKSTDRVVFDIETANALPFFPFCPEDLHLNPYVPAPFSKAAIQGDKNCLGMKMIKNYKNYGVGTLDDFKNKFNIFSSGSKDHNIFDGMDWTDIAVSGSLIPACVPKGEPLVDDMPGEDYDKKLANFYGHKRYYRSSDIDMMCYTTSIYEFMDKVSNIVDVIKGNIQKQYPEKDIVMQVIPNKPLLIVVSKDFLKRQFGVEDVKSSDVILRFDLYLMYIRLKHKAVKYHSEHCTKENQFYKAFYLPSAISDMTLLIVDSVNKDEGFSDIEGEITIRHNDVFEDEDKINPIVFKICENIKFKVHSQNMVRPVEIFKTRYAEHFGTIARFHLPIVRGYYDGTTVKLLSSCITAIMTRVNLGYRYFAGVRDPIVIINKYRDRGYGIILNPKEHVHLVKHNLSIKKLKKLYKLNIKNKGSIQWHIGPLQKKTNIIPLGGVEQYIDTVADIEEWYKKEVGYSKGSHTLDFLKYKTIADDGNVVPIKAWLCDAAFDVFFEGES
jgi:hypothetical protein